MHARGPRRCRLSAMKEFIVARYEHDPTQLAGEVIQRPDYYNTYTHLDYTLEINFTSPMSKNGPIVFIND